MTKNNNNIRKVSRMVGIILKTYRRRLYKLISPLLSDKIIIKRRYLKRFGHMPDLVNPKLFNEKVMWRMLYDRRPIFQRISDKVEVRNYAEEKGLGRFLPKQYYATDDPSTINPETLPKSFVIKPNHACNFIHIVHDKEKANWKKIVNLCNEWLKVDYYKVARERQYKNIPRKIIVQEFLGQGKAVAPEYKFHCFDGEPKLILVSLGRYSTQHTEGWFDSSWKPKGQDTTMKRSVHIPKPDRLNELIKVARKFAAGFDYIRVDLYLLPKKIVFGELTATAASGVGMRSKEVQEDLGATWKLNTKVRTK